mmetsp:Transcript_12632/g.58405  ORF Transcript_12632/g.58405 Transcript_12632/m.58405 type:complete len:215 (+) Transcript_12632:3590-4234(+)
MRRPRRPHGRPSPRRSQPSPARARSAARPRSPAATARGEAGGNSCTWFPRGLNSGRSARTRRRRWKACHHRAEATRMVCLGHPTRRRSRRTRSNPVPARRRRHRSGRRCDRGARVESSTGSTARWPWARPRMERPRSRPWRVPSRVLPWAVARLPRARRAAWGRWASRRRRSPSNSPRWERETRMELVTRLKQPDRGPSRRRTRATATARASRR